MALATSDRLLALDAADAERRRALRRMKLVASSLLVVAAVIYVLTHGQDGALGYVNAAAEASMVGAMADWFAVTALFRHPLGIPVPHTALVPKRKDSFALSLEEFVQAHFLTGDAVRERYEEAEITKRAGDWLTDRAHAERVVHEGSRIARRVLGRIRDDEVQALLETVLLPRLADEPAAPLAGAMLQQFVADGSHQDVIDLGCDELIEWLQGNQDTFEALLVERAPGWTPDWLNAIVTDRVHHEAVSWLQDIRADQGHRARVAIGKLLFDLADNLQHDQRTIDRAEALKQRWLSHPQTLSTAMSLWDIGRTVMVDALADEQGHLRTRLADEVQAVGARVRDDDQLRARLDSDIGAAITFAVENYADEMLPVITQVISSWDGREASERIELHVGRDLQFIRINGTLVGGLVGLIIHALSEAL
jgi:uncharacterized membrane-anchored protein YjiN (DUF445 family)